MVQLSHNIARIHDLLSLGPKQAMISRPLWLHRLDFGRYLTDSSFRAEVSPCTCPVRSDTDTSFVLQVPWKNPELVYRLAVYLNAKQMRNEISKTEFQDQLAGYGLISGMCYASHQPLSRVH